MFTGTEKELEKIMSQLASTENKELVGDMVEKMNAPDWMMNALYTTIKDNDEPDYMLFFLLTASLPIDAFKDESTLDAYLSCWLTIQKKPGQDEEYTRAKLILMYQKRYQEAWGISPV